MLFGIVILDLKLVFFLIFEIRFNMFDEARLDEFCFVCFAFFGLGLIIVGENAFRSDHFAHPNLIYILGFSLRFLLSEALINF